MQTRDGERGDFRFSGRPISPTNRARGRGKLAAGAIFQGRAVGEQGAHDEGRIALN